MRDGEEYGGVRRGGEGWEGGHADHAHGPPSVVT